MTKEEIRRLYQENILPEEKDPYHFSPLADANTRIEAHNPFCGDKYVISLKVKDDRISEAHFEGIGCSLSKASASVLLRHLEGKSGREVKAFCQEFLNAFEGDTVPSFQDPAVDVLVRLKEFGGRQDCIKLGWLAISKYFR